MYRPRAVESIHLRSVRETIQKLLEAPRFPHVFLFAGPKGTGKTSVSRIIGAILNEPKNEPAVKARLFGESGKTAPKFVAAEKSPQADAIFSGESFLVSEQDAASNRGIDDVRQLKERAYISPIGGVVSVYILDEVHMLSNDAFNALLKLLEEPPAHTVFILATTELHKIPDTIISRCTVIPFHKASPAELEDSLNAIAKAENLNVKKEDLATISLLADGSFRDAVKYLELQHSLGGASLTDALHIPTTSFCWDLLQAVVNKDEVKVLTLFQNARDVGLEEKHLIKLLVSLLHDDVLASYGVTDETAHFSERISLFLLHALSVVDLNKPNPIPHLRLELALLELITRAKDKTAGTGGGGQTQANAPQIATPKKVIEEVKIHTAQSTTPQQIPEETDVVPSLGTPSDAQLGDGTLIIARWQELVSRVSNHNFSLAALLKSATPLEGSQGQATIRVFYEFHKDQLLQPRWLALVQELLTEFAGGYIKLHCVVQSHKDSELVETDAAPDLQRSVVEALT